MKPETVVRFFLTAVLLYFIYQGSQIAITLAFFLTFVSIETITHLLKLRDD